MPHNPRRDSTRQRTQEREQKAWQLRTTGFSQWQIATQLGLSQPAVSKILARVGKRLAAEFRAEALAVKMVQTEVLERVAAEALVAWHQSKKDAETVSVVQGRVGKDGQPLPELITTTREGQSGNPSHLQQLRGALSDIRAIWGLDSPQRQEHSGPDGAPIRISEIVVELPPGRESESLESEEQESDGWQSEAPEPVAPSSNGAGLEVVMELPG